MRNPMNFGAHVSVAGGVDKAPARGEKLDCKSIQIFTKNQMQWEAAPLENRAIQNFRENVEKYHIDTVVTHASYLINLGSPEEEKLEKSRQAFLEEIQRCHQLNIPYLVVHPGAHMGSGESEALDTIAESVNWAHAETEGSAVMTLLENTAGQGTNVCYDFGHLKTIIENVKDQSRIGVCLDTSHLFAAGYDLRTENAYNQSWEKFERAVGFEWLKVFHLNDSKKELGTRVDRHDNLGKGHLGLEPFRFLLNDERFFGIPMILETPGGDKWYAKNLKVMRELVEK